MRCLKCSCREDQNAMILRKNPNPDETIAEAIDLLKAGYVSPKELLQYISPDLMDASKYLKSLIAQLTKFIKENGISFNMSDTSGVPDTYLWIENESTQETSGLCIAISTRNVTSALVRHFGLENEDYWWSANPLFALYRIRYQPTGEAEVYLYEWKIDWKK